MMHPMMMHGCGGRIVNDNGVGKCSSCSALLSSPCLLDQRNRGREIGDAPRFPFHGY